MILSENEIIDLLPAIFVMDTYVSEGVREASYVLRVASDQLMFEDKVYELGTYPQASSIVINPGKIAVLSTVERLHMPKDLVGKIGIRLQYALQGLTGLMGIQVDPRYGEHRGGERLYIRVANLGVNPITLYPNDRVFTFELHQLTSEVKNDKYLNKDITWDVLRRNLPGPQDASWSYASRINDETRQRERQYQRRFNRQIAGIRDYLQPIVMFGIFLVAVTILGGIADRDIGCQPYAKRRSPGMDKAVGVDPHFGHCQHRHNRYSRLWRIGLLPHCQGPMGERN